MHSVWKTSIRFTIVTTILLGLGYPLVVTGIAGVIFPAQGRRQPHPQRRPGHRLRAARPELHLRQILPSPPLGRRQRLRRHCLRRLQPGPIQQSSRRPHPGLHRQARRGEPRQSRSHRHGHHLRLRPRSRHHARRRLFSGSTRSQSPRHLRRPHSPAHRRSTPRLASSASSAKPASMSLNSTSPSTSSRNKPASRPKKIGPSRRKGQSAALFERTN